MKLRLEHRLPKKLRYAKVYFEAGNAKVSFSLDGTNANWQASIGKRGGVEMSDKEYARLRANLPAVETIDDNGQVVIVRDSEGFEEQWTKPQWVLRSVRKAKRAERDASP